MFLHTVHEPVRILCIALGTPICLSDVSCFIMTRMSFNITLHARFCQHCKQVIQRYIDLISEIS